MLRIQMTNISLLLPLTQGNAVAPHVMLVHPLSAAVTNTRLPPQSVLALPPFPGTCKPPQALFQALRVNRTLGPVRIAHGFSVTIARLISNDISGRILVSRDLHSGSAVVYLLNPLQHTTFPTALPLTFAMRNNGLEVVGGSSVGETHSNAILAMTTSLVSGISMRLLTFVMIECTDFDQTIGRNHLIGMLDVPYFRCGTDRSRVYPTAHTYMYSQVYPKD
jgi:hypothetical protein